MPRVRAMVGLPVIREGERLGRVSGIKLTDDMDSLQGIWVDTGLTGGRFLPEEEIEVLGEVSVLVSGRGRREKSSEKPCMRRAVSVSGQRVGAVTDVFVDAESRQVQAVELSGGLWDDLIRGRQRIPQFSVRPNGEIVVEESAEGGDGS